MVIRNYSLFILSLLCICILFANSTFAQSADEAATKQSVGTETTSIDESESDKSRNPLHEKFQKGLTNTKFIGNFTVTGMEDKAPKEEEYTITSVKKLEKGDWWEIVARIKYGDHDLTVPMRMEVKWADKTPVITVDRLFIPGLGTFDARVLLRKDKYAGTWAHDSVGGHLFGRIVKLDEKSKTDQ